MQKLIESEDAAQDDDRTETDISNNDIDNSARWSIFPELSYRGFNSNTVRDTVPYLWKTDHSLWVHGDFDFYVRKKVMQEDIIQPVIDEENQKKLDAAEQDKIGEENMSRLSQAATTRLHDAEPEASSTSRAKPDEKIYAVDLSRLADAADMVSKVSETPARRQARNSMNGPMTPTSAPRNSSNKRSAPTPIAAAPPKRRRSSGPNLQPSPFAADPATSTPSTRYPPIQPHPGSMPPPPPLHLSPVHNPYAMHSPLPPIYPAPPIQPQQQPHYHHHHLQPTPTPIQPAPQATTTTPTPRRRKAATTKDQRHSPYEFRMVTPGKPTRKQAAAANKAANNATATTDGVGGKAK